MRKLSNFTHNVRHDLHVVTVRVVESWRVDKVKAHSFAIVILLSRLDDGIVFY
jgi:hypothetical protein